MRRSGVLTKICKDYNIGLVEHAAEGSGSFCQSKHVDTFGDVAILSFSRNIIFITGGAGAVMTNNREIAASVRHLSTTAKTIHPWQFHHHIIGYNYRMPNLNAALGIAQMGQPLSKPKLKRKLAEQYRNLLTSSERVKLFQSPENRSPSHWLNTLILDEPSIKRSNHDGVTSDKSYGKACAGVTAHTANV